MGTGTVAIAVITPSSGPGTVKPLIADVIATGAPNATLARPGQTGGTVATVGNIDALSEAKLAGVRSMTQRTSEVPASTSQTESFPPFTQATAGYTREAQAKIVASVAMIVEKSRSVIVGPITSAPLNDQ